MRLPPFSLCDQVAVVRLSGDKLTRPEPEAVRIVFPGGDVEVTRTTYGAYWVHVRVDRPGAGLFTPGETVPAVIADARLDAHGAEPVAIPTTGDTYHLAVLVRRDGVAPLADQTPAEVA